MRGLGNLIGGTRVRLRERPDRLLSLRRHRVVRLHSGLPGLLAHRLLLLRTHSLVGTALDLRLLRRNVVLSWGG